MKEYFVIERGEHIGDNWTLCFGSDENGAYAIGTNHMSGSDAMFFLHGAKADAELVCRLLNEYYTSQLG